MDGTINGVRFASQPLFANVTPMIDSNQVDVHFDTAPRQYSAATRWQLFNFMTLENFQGGHRFRRRSLLDDGVRQGRRQRIRALQG